MGAEVAVGDIWGDNWHMLHSTWHQVHGTWHLLPCTWYMVHGTWYMAPGTWYVINYSQQELGKLRSSQC